MSVVQAATNERSLRSVFVGNIPYDASEEKLKDIFSEVGPVLSFKLVYDRESGKPKGYGFCEYRDQETASSAMRNLNGYELSGRNLRVDTATNERFKEEIKNLQTTVSGTTFESPYGAEVDPEKAPEAIAKIAASMAPEQMFELARQMKHCVLTNANEARNMLVQNPQLAYALLQTLVVMRAVDVNAASAILYKPNPAPPPLHLPGSAIMAPVTPMVGVPPPPTAVPQPHPVPPPNSGIPQPLSQPPQQQQQPPLSQPPQMMYDAHQMAMEHHMYGNRPAAMNHSANVMGVVGAPAPPLPPPQQQQPPPSSAAVGVVVGGPPLDPRIKTEPRPDMFDPRANSMIPPNSGPGGVNSVGANVAPLDPRLRNQPPIDPRQAAAAAAAAAAGMARSGSQSLGSQQQLGSQQGFVNRFAPPPPVSSGPSSSSSSSASSSSSSASQAQPQSQPPVSSSGSSGSGSAAAAPAPPREDQEKTALIMQVLALSDQQIAMLPSDQRQSIMLLREQLARNGQP